MIWLPKATVAPCPFCGGTDLTIEPRGQSWYIGCWGCDCGFLPFRHNREQAIDFWNKRCEKTKADG